MRSHSARFAPLFAVFVLLLASRPAFAHATLTESDPPEGGSVALPFTLVLRYDDQLDPLQSSVVVRNQAGDILAEGGVVEDAFTMVADLENLPLGAYQAHWVAITPDDQGKTQGDINFNIVAATPAPTATPPITLPPPGSATPSATAAATPPQPTVTPPPSAVTVETPGPTPGPPTTQASGAELIVPLVLAGGVAVALVWILLRRRST